MLLGVLAGRWFPRRRKHLNERFQFICTLLLIFAMGASLGGREAFFADLARIGAESFLFCVFPIAGSILVVYPLTRRYMGESQGRRILRPGQTAKTSDPMVFLAVGALLSGIACGASPALSPFLAPLADQAELLLYLLMFSVGITVGLREGLIASLRQYHLRILLLPAGIIAGSLAGGAAAWGFTDYTLAESLSIAGGLGWYSLAGVAIGQLAGPELGSVAFLASLLREILAFFLIPILARTLNDWTAIAPAAATSEDTTLPMLIRYTDEETVIFAVVNGILCSAAVPVIIPLCY